MRFARKIYREQFKKERKEGKKLLKQQRMEAQLSQFYFDRARVIVNRNRGQNLNFAFAQATSTHLSKSFPAWVGAEALKRARANFDAWTGDKEGYEKKEAEENARKEAEVAAPLTEEIKPSLEENGSLEILNESAIAAKKEMGV